MRVTVLFLAAGRGRRFGGPVPKQYCCVDGVPLIVIALESLAREPRIHAVQPVVAARDEEFSRCLQGREFPFEILPPVTGGSHREISMARGLSALAPDVEWVAVQDAARPTPSPALLARVMDTAARHGAAVPGIRVHDTIKQVNGEGRVVATLERETLRAVQTPQVARRTWLAQAVREQADRLPSFTDDAALLEAAGFPVFVSEGDANNRKITTPEDLAWLRSYLEARK